MNQQKINIIGAVLTILVSLIFFYEGNLTLGIMFVAAGLIMLGLNLYVFSAERKLMDNSLLKNPSVIDFYERTQKVWADGKLSAISDTFEKTARKSQYNQFVRAFFPYDNSALYIFFNQYSILEDEYMILIFNEEKTKNPAWFILTNKRLLQRDGETDKFVEIPLVEISSYTTEEIDDAINLVFEMKSGKVISLHKVQKALDKEDFDQILAMIEDL